MFGLAMKSEVLALERRLETLMAHLDVAERDLATQQVRDLAAADETVEAVKLHRRETGARLLTAKRVVDTFRGDATQA